MIKECAILFFVLLALLVGWSFYEKSQWLIDYTLLTPEFIELQTLDTSFEENIIPNYFDDAFVISDSTNLRVPEDIVIASDGTMYSGLLDGVIAKITPEGKISQLIKLSQAGQILGIILTKDEQTLYFVTELQGLAKLDLSTLTPTILLNDLKGKKLVLNNLCIDEKNQIVYLTNSGMFNGRFQTKKMFMKHKEGQIIAYSLKTGETEIIGEKMSFPNGIDYEESTESVLISEMNLHRILRLYVDGPKKGQQQILIDQLFGFPDNLKLNQNGELLIAIPIVRDDSSDLLNRRPDIRKFLIYLPEILTTKIISMMRKIAGGIKIDTKTGKIIQYLFGEPTQISFVTTVLEKNGKTYFSSLQSPTILVIKNTSKPKTVTINSDKQNDL